MEHLDEHEMLIEYAEMTSFDFNSKEFQEVRKDVMACKNTLSGIETFVRNVASGFRPVNNY